MAQRNDNLFQRLTNLFRSGPVVKRKVRAVKEPNISTANDVFKKTLSHAYSSSMSAYGTYDRMARYSDYSEMEYCLSGDTLIAVPGGYERIEDLAKKHGLDEEFIVYSYDHNKRQIVPALAKQARKTREDHAYRVVFDSGKEIIGTGNHRLMLRDGTYRRIDELSPGDSMMPFYRKDLFEACDKPTNYLWIYTMTDESRNGWITEHKLIAEWSQRKLRKNEVVHHKDFNPKNNLPDNLEIMDRAEHYRYHAQILNGKKWNLEKNGDWIREFKKTHSAWMRENNPAERKDITFGRILEICEREGFNSSKISKVLDTDVNVIKRRLRQNGFDDFATFAKAYDPAWRNNGWQNSGEKNPRYDRTLTYQQICDAFKPGMSSQELASILSTTPAKITNRVKSAGYRSYGDFKQNYANHKVVSVEYYGIIPLYDLTVDGYKNFATDSVVSHNTPEIASALDIYAEESSSPDEKGRSLKVTSDNRQIQQILNDLFFDTLNVEFNLIPWTRDLVKYGDVFLFNDVSTQYGVQNVFPIPVNEIEREEGFDPADPMAVRFRWVTQGNTVLENWQVTHMRLLGNDAFLPYGTSVLESARRIWRQLILIEDAMLVYRVVRSPERRVFYIDVGNVPPEDVGNYMEQAKSILRSNQVIDQQTGRVDLRYNPLSVDEDYFIPIRGSESGTKIDTLAGGTNVTAIEDVEYIQKKLFSALKIPKAYLGYDEALSSKATLAQEDIRFSRSIARIQKVILSELNKLAIIHLYCHGYDGDDLLDFELQLSNPSTIAQQQKLELIRTKFDISAAAPEGLVDRYWIRKNVMGLTDEEIDKIEQGRIKDKKREVEIEAAAIPAEEPGAGDELGAGGPPIGGGGGGALDLDLDLGGEEEAEGEEEPEPLEAGQKIRSTSLLTGLDESDDDDEDFVFPEPGEGTPIKKASVVDKTLRNRKRRDRRVELGVKPPDFKKMLSGDAADTLRRPFGNLHSKEDLNPMSRAFEDYSIDPLQNFLNSGVTAQAQMTNRMRSTLKSLDSRIGKPGRPGLISESGIDDMIDLNVEDVTLLGESTDD